MSLIPAYLLGNLLRLTPRSMAPTPAAWNPLEAVCNNYWQFEGSVDVYQNILGGLTTIMGFGGVIARLIQKGWKLPK